MSIEHVELADYLAIAAEVTGLELETLTRVAKVDLAESALHAPTAGFGDTEFYPAFIEKAAVLVVRLAKNHGLPPLSWSERSDLTLPNRGKTNPAEQKAWQALRAGEPERAMAHYKARGRLHLTDTRDQAAESAVQAWAQLTEQHDIRKVALIADASNTEIDRLNARAQHLRAERGELGNREVPLASVNCGLREGDHVAELDTDEHKLGLGYER